MLVHLRGELFWSLGVCYLRHSRVLQSGSDCPMNLLYRQNQRRTGNKIKSVWDFNNSSSGCRVPLLEAIVERKLLLIWNYNDFLLQISKKKHHQVSVKETSIFIAGGSTLSLYFFLSLSFPYVTPSFKIFRSKQSNLKPGYYTDLCTSAYHI